MILMMILDLTVTKIDSVIYNVHILEPSSNYIYDIYHGWFSMIKLFFIVKKYPDRTVKYAAEKYNNEYKAIQPLLPFAT